MSREELINKILDLRPRILSKEELDNLDADTLASLYSANCSLNFYTLTEKMAFISQIQIFYGDNTSKVLLLMKEPSDILDIYLCEIRNITKEQFEGEYRIYKEQREAAAIDNEDDLYLGYTEIEKKLEFYATLHPSDDEIAEYVARIIAEYEVKISEVNEEMDNESRELSSNESDLDRSKLRHDQKKELISDIKKGKKRLLELRQILECYNQLKGEQEDRLELLRTPFNN